MCNIVKGVTRALGIAPKVPAIPATPAAPPVSAAVPNPVQQAPATTVPDAPSSSPAATAASDEERRRAAAQAGRAGTVLTGGLGVTDAAPVARKTLLGG